VYQKGAAVLQPGPRGVLALIPAYNEGSRIEPVIEGAARHLPVLVVDDGSSDDTGGRAEAAGAAVLRQSPNAGKGAALRAGFRTALEAGAHAVVTLDADGQHDPAEIPRFLAAREDRGADLVIGARDFSEMPPLRRLSNTFARRAFSWAMGETILDNQSGYRLIARPVMEAVLASDESGFEFEVEMIAVCVERGLRLAWVPIRTIYGDETSHINPVRHTVQFLRVVIETRRRMRDRAPRG
jgi:glycosyltransferase involved in cell wall biosynthesis